MTARDGGEATAGGFALGYTASSNPTYGFSASAADG
jgi:hypothetical protein